MKKILILLITLLSLIITTGRAEAKWWIFGQGNDEININYLFLNRTSYDELGSKVVLFNDNLQNGMVSITGKASVKSGKIGYVQVSTDGKASWQPAKLSASGSFEYSFAPDIDRDYDVYVEINDTSGRKNDVEATYKKLTVKNENTASLVKDTLNELVSAYENEEENRFMNLVSNEFAGDIAVLDSAVRQDFNNFDAIKLNLYVNNVTRSSDGKIYAAIQYNRILISTKSGQTYSDKGYTELIFKNENGKLMVSSMKNPLIFGLSNASEVATGTIKSPTNDPIIIVTSTGTVDEKPFDEAIDIIENNGNPTTEDNSATIASGTGISVDYFAFVGNNVHSFTFSSESTNLDASAALVGDITALNNGGAQNILVKTGTKHLLLGTGSLDSYDSVPDESTYLSSHHFLCSTGEVYAFKLTNGNYAIIKITAASLGGGTAQMDFDYKYQSNGSRNFK